LRNEFAGYSQISFQCRAERSDGAWGLGIPSGDAALQNLILPFPICGLTLRCLKSFRIPI
jgi:hypothetical protein